MIFRPSIQIARGNSTFTASSVTAMRWDTRDRRSFIDAVKDPITLSVGTLIAKARFSKECWDPQFPRASQQWSILSASKRTKRELYAL